VKFLGCSGSLAVVLVCCSSWAGIGFAQVVAAMCAWARPIRIFMNVIFGPDF